MSGHRTWNLGPVYHSVYLVSRRCFVICDTDGESDGIVSIAEYMSGGLN